MRAPEVLDPAAETRDFLAASGEEYRRRGLGEALLCAAVRLALERGQYAFGQVFTDNRPSLALQRKVGMTVSEDILYWLF